MAPDGTLSCVSQEQLKVQRRGAPVADVDLDGDSGGSTVRVLFIEDHSVVRAGLRNLLAAADRAIEVHEAADGRIALTLLRSVRPDLILLDLNLPGMGGLELLRRVLLEDKAARVLVLSMHAEPLYAARALEAGARGYISKNASPDEFVLAVRRVAKGERYIENEIAQELALQSVAPGPVPSLSQLTVREVEILRLLAAGRSLTEIAEALGVSYKTVANTCSIIKTKLGLPRLESLVRYAIKIETGS